MNRFERIRTVLKTCFNAEDGLSPDAARRVYLRMIEGSPALSGFEAELREALRDPEVSWREMLLNDDYEVCDVESEAEARDCAVKLLLEPLEARA